MSRPMQIILALPLLASGPILLAGSAAELRHFAARGAETLLLFILFAGIGLGLTTLGVRLLRGPGKGGQLLFSPVALVVWGIALLILQGAVLVSGMELPWTWDQYGGNLAPFSVAVGCFIVARRRRRKQN